jgi:hypothetical protein
LAVSFSKADTYDTFLLKKKGQDKLQLYPDLGDDSVTLEKPSDDDLVEANKQFEKLKERQGKFEFILGLGGAPNLSKDLSRAYTPGFGFDVGIGQRLSPQFSYLLDFEGTVVWPSDDQWNGDLTVSNLNIALLAKFRLSEKGVRPYLFLGPGLAANSSNFKFGSDGLDGNYTLSSGGFLLEGGVGIEVPIIKFLYVYLQGRTVCEFENSNFASYAGIDNTSVYVPIEMGIVFTK